jgi:hypothetical protein
MKRIIAFFGIACAFVYLTAAGYTFAAASGVRTQSGGKQLIADGDMEQAGTASWPAYAGGITSKQPGGASDGHLILRLSYDGSSALGFANATPSPLTVGKTYHITGWARGDGSALPRVGDGNIDFVWIGTASNQWQRFDFYGKKVTSSIMNFYLYSWNLSAGHYVEFDDVVVTEAPGKVVTNGKNLLVGGDMENKIPFTGVFNGGVASLVSGSAKEGSKVLRIAYSTAPGSPFAQTNTVVTTGKRYRVTGWARADGTGGYPRILLGGSSNTFVGTVSTAWQRIDVTAVADGTAFIAQCYAISGPGYCEFDDLVVIEYPGKTVSGGKQLFPDGDMEKPGFTDWNAFNGAVLSKVAGAAKEGKYVLRVTPNSTYYGTAMTTPLVVGKRYRITGYGRGDGVNNVAYLGNLNISDLGLVTSTGAWQKFDKSFTAVATTIYLGSLGVIHGHSDFDDIVLTEL